MRNMLVVPNNGGELTHPVYFFDSASGEFLYAVRMHNAGYIKKLLMLTENRRRIVSMRGISSAEYSVAPGKDKLFIKTWRPGVMIVDVESFGEVHEPYLPTWLLWMEPRLVKWFERFGGGSELIEKRVDEVDRAASWVPRSWVDYLIAGGGGFVDDRHVLVGAFNEVRLYDLEDGLVAREENPHFLRGVLGHFFGGWWWFGSCWCF